MPHVEPERYTARICWNSNNWCFPSGEAPHLETDSYVVHTGFGHEEWLFNYSWLIKGFHYAFLQPINRSFDNVTGKTVEVFLYTINGLSQRLYVGQLSECEVLRTDQAQTAVEEYRQRGWLKSMADQVAQVQGNVDHILAETQPKYLFNIRFRPENAQKFDPLVLADRSDAIWKFQRYTLVPADESIANQWKKHAGKATPPVIRTINRRGTPSLTYDPLHIRLQADLHGLLEDRYGHGNVLRECDNVDITIRESGKTILVEIKTNPVPRAAIREALSQLMEYAYYHPAKRDGAIELVILAPGRIDAAADEYLNYLRKRFKIPVRYCSHSEGDPLPNVFKAH